MIPLVGEYAPANKKGFVLSIIVSGLLLGMLIARLLSGILANYTSWRNIYWFACGAQYLIGTALFFFMPDYPSTNSGLGYFKALWSILCFIVTEPLLVQASLIVYFCSAVFTSFWTTLTFLLASPPYEYSSLVIGLFALLGIAAIIFVPLWGKVIDRFVPLFSILIAELILLATVIIGTFTGTFTVAGPIIAAIGIDVGIQVAQVANRTAIFAINPKARNRTNTAYMAFAFAGQLSGTAIGNRLYAKGGWRYSGGFASESHVPFEFHWLFTDHSSRFCRRLHHRSPCARSSREALGWMARWVGDSKEVTCCRSPRACRFWERLGGEGRV